MEWRQEKDMPVFMYIFLNKIEDAEEARWTEKEKNEGYKTYKKAWLRKCRIQRYIESFVRRYLKM